MISRIIFCVALDFRVQFYGQVPLSDNPKTTNSIESFYRQYNGQFYFDINHWEYFILVLY